DHIKHLSECGADVFVRLYESILGEKVPDFIAAPRSQEDDAHNVQAVIDSLALDYLQVSLSHITELFVPSHDVDGSESTSELIRLGDTAHSFSERGEVMNRLCWVNHSDRWQPSSVVPDGLSSSAKKLGEPIRQAIPLLPPFQPAEARSHDPVERDYQSSDSQSVPWVYGTSTSASPLDQKFSLHTEQVAQTPRPQSRHLPRKKRYENSTTDSLEESLSPRTTKENLSKQELHKVSEKLSRRLNELDLMLKRALGEHAREEEVTDEDSLSQHSDSVMDYRRRKTKQGNFTTKCILQEFIVYICLYLVVEVRDDDLLLQLLEEFPHLHISNHMMNKMWRQQLAQTEQLKAASGRARLKLQNEVTRTELLTEQVKEKRQQIVRARKYYEDYRVQLRAKMMRARTREERIFKNLFEEGLEIQKQRLKDLRAYAQEMRAEQRREHQNELESMENYYKDQFSMLAEALSQERQEIQTREKAQAQMLQKTKRELRSRMEKEIQQLQTAIMQNDDDTFFQELEADRLKSRLQMASFQYSKSSFS
uniref:Centrosomal protein 95 n=1 Tax=Anser cygnoides TaxID=8845 RepID=A0A8B9D4U7_ANSCY